MFTAGIIVMLCAGAPSSDVRGLDAAVKVTSWNAGTSEGVPGAPVRVTCWAHKTFAVVETNDPGLKGSPAVVIRPRKDKADPCSRSYAGQGITVNAEEEVYVEGVRGPWVVLKGADGFGSHMRLLVVDSASGTVVLRTTRFLGEPVKFSDDAVEFVAALSPKCDPRAEGCVTATARAAGADAAASFTFDVAACGKTTPQDTLQVGVRARVDNLRKPVTRLLAGPVSCGIEP